MPPAVAPLPYWTIDGVEFDNKVGAHLRRVLSVFGCRSDCPAVSDHLEYFSGVFSNARDEHTGLQVYVRGTKLLSAQWDLWAERDCDHDHPVDKDLVYPYVRVHPFPFTFSRPIRVQYSTSDEPITLHVSDIHLRWSEIRRCLEFPAGLYVPERYPKLGYPFNRDYFYQVSSLFTTVHPSFPNEHFATPIIHAPTGLPLQIVPYETLYRCILAFALHDSSPSSVPLTLLVSTQDLLRTLQALSGVWWLHGELAVRDAHIIDFDLCSSMDEEMRRSLLSGPDGFVLPDFDVPYHPYHPLSAPSDPFTVYEA